MDDIDTLALKAQNGDKAARELIVKKFTPLVRRMASAFASTRILREDLEQEGFVSILESLKGFDPAKSSFVGRASFLIHSAIYASAKKQKAIYARYGHNKVEMLEEKTEEEKGSVCQVSLDDLSERERYIVISHFGLCGLPAMTQDEIAKKLGTINRKRVSQILKAALNKLRWASIKKVVE